MLVIFTIFMIFTTNEQLIHAIAKLIRVLMYRQMTYDTLLPFDARIIFQSEENNFFVILVMKGDE